MVNSIRSLRNGLALSALLALPLAAQTDHMHLGGRFNYDATSSNAGIGVQFSGPLSNRFEFYPSFDWYFPDVGTRWTGNFDVKYRFRGAAPPEWWYIGTGVAVDYVALGDVSHMDAGFNLFTGVEPLRGKIHPFIEVRLTARDGTRVGVALGFNVTLGKANQ